jgi:para-nitrobenzyl esterase
VLNLFRTTRNWTDDDRALSVRMTDSLVAIARGGDPATPATPWPRWTPRAPRQLAFGDAVQVAMEESAPRPPPRPAGDQARLF